MTTNGLYEDDLEKKQHLHAIQTLAEGVKVSKEEIYRLYEDVLKEFKREARVKIFLSILVSKRVRELLEKKDPLS